MFEFGIWITVLLLAALAALGVASLFGQATTLGSIVGNVVDPQNAARAGHPFASLLLGLPNVGGRISGEADLDTDQALHHLWAPEEHRRERSIRRTSPQDSSNIRASMGPSDFDQTHVFNTGNSNLIPTGITSPLRHLLGGWQTTGIWTLETGRPFNITLAQDIANVGARGDSQRPNLVGNPFASGFKKTYGLDARAFAAPPAFTFGSLGLNALRGPGFKNFDIGLFKNFDYHERFRSQYRAEFFNVFNNVNFSDPGTHVH